ncbi:MAG: DNA-processing protein DprA [Acetobacteraceae bacterium]|nr:DNA-processing protein DprA [Acetobacteraceae bacterium]
MPATPDPADALDRLRLIRTEGIGPVTYRRLLERYLTPAAALDAVPQLARAGGRPAPPVVSTREAAAHEIEQTRRLGGRLLFLGTPGYPPLLALLDDAPPCLAVLGDPALLSASAVAMVGGRNASSNGQRIAEALAGDLARSVVVVSGLARGIDTAAHVGAMRTGRTVAAVAGGLDQPYPEENVALQNQIVANGAVVTEAPFGTAPQARHFPRRNRIIAGLSLGVVVVEAALRSGSLITARIAQEAGREVFAVPGSPLDPRARGGNDLIRQGALMAETAEDVLGTLPAFPTAVPHGMVAEQPQEAPLTPPDAPAIPPDARQTVLALLSAAPTAVDDLVRRCQLSPSAVAAVLLELELAGRVEALPGGCVTLLAAAL